jgi:hypothetical protein
LPTVCCDIILEAKALVKMKIPVDNLLFFVWRPDVL